MRPVNTKARLLLDNELRLYGRSDAVTLASALGVSVPSIHRMVRERGHEIVRVGTTKSARYVLRRALRGQVAPIPVYAIDIKGRGRELALMDIVAPQGSILDVKSMGWPTPSGNHSWWDGMPYPMQDMRPQGFLGRNFAKQISHDFGVSENPEEWSDDDIIYILAVKGHDSPGNLIIGVAAYRAYLGTLTQPVDYITDATLPDRYAELATIATQHGGGGSSAGGEFPKFTAIRKLSDALTSHVIVKFSGADESASVRRWSDLLVCENLALEVLRHYKLPAALSRIIQAHGRTFLEVERFDRVGDFGRVAVASLASLDSAFIGMGNGSWVEVATRLAKEEVLPDALIERIRILHWFGRLIANSDMHFGNLSFLLAPDVNLAPAYDMLPMLYAPLAGGEVPQRQFEIKLAMPDEQAAWDIALNMAVTFWDMASQDHRITAGFRAICLENQAMLNALRERLGG